MRHLRGEVEDDVAALDESRHLLLVADVGNVDVQVVQDLADVREVPAVALDHRVAHGDARTVFEQPDGEVRTDETETARDEDVLPGEGPHSPDHDSIGCTIRSKRGSSEEPLSA